MTIPHDDADTDVVSLGNGVRVVAIRLPHLETACASVFVRTGSAHESRRLNGVSHFVEHMAFKGTHERTCQQINLDAERLGADVNAHTDKDHTAYHLRGRARDAEQFVAMLGDIALNSTFPAAELERERGVLVQEYVEDEDEPLSIAYRLFDRLSFGSHPMAQPVIGTRANIGRISRDDLLGYVAAQYSGANIVVAVAGNVDTDRIAREAEAAFGGVRAGTPNLVARPAHIGGTASRALSGSSQTHLVVGMPIPPLTDESHHASVVAAALFGEGMSSPLLDEVRERRGLAYYVSCSADVLELAGQFVIEASTAPEHADEFLAEVKRLLGAQASAIATVDLERARNQIAVRRLRAAEKPSRRLEDAALDLLALGRVRPRAELAGQIDDVTAASVRRAFEQMLAAPAAVAIAGRIRKGVPERARQIFTGRARS
ncbi:MAG: pitrilysin family protein [Caldimonas sp.]